MWHRLPRLSLVRRIVLSVTLCLTVILVLHLLVVMSTIDESIQAAFQERLILAKVLAGRVDEGLSHARVTLQAASVQPDLIAGPREWLNAHRQSLADFRRVSLVDPAGAILWTELANSDAAVTPDIDSEGVRTLLTTGQPAVTEVVMGRLTFARLVIPIVGTDGEPLGALVGDLDPGEPDLALLPARGLDGGGVAQLMNADGQLLAGARVPGPNAAREHAALMADLIRTATPGYRIHAAGPEAPYASHVVAYAPVASLPTWGVAVEQPIDMVLAAPRQLERRLAVTGAASFALILALAWIDVRRVVRPLRYLTEVADRITAGNLDEPVHVEQGDELGVLTQAFEMMRAQLKASLAKLQNLAVLEERERIAREMHDGLGQMLGYVNTKTLAVGRLLDMGKVEEARAQVTELEEAAKGLYADVREAILGLRTSVGPDRDLPTALRDYVRGFGQQSGIEVQLQIAAWPEQPLLSLAAEVQLVRIVQEALANVRKHAAAQHAVVGLTVEGSLVQVTVQDDGIGFDRAALTRDSWPRFGLQTMQERAEGIGGVFGIESSVGAGTRVRISVPTCASGAPGTREVSHAAAASAPG